MVRLQAQDQGGNIVRTETQVDVSGDLKLGNFQLSFTDLEIPVSGIPITVTRTYDSLRADQQDEMGFGWRLEFRDTDLRNSLERDELFEELGVRSNAFDAGTRVYITVPGGRREAFTFNPEPIFNLGRLPGEEKDTQLFLPRFRGDRGVTSTLSVAEVYIIQGADDRFYGLNSGEYDPANVDYGFGGYYELTTKEGIIYRIDAETGDLISVRNPNNNVLTYSDNGVESSTGKKVSFVRDNQDRIKRLTDPMGFAIEYDYDTSGDLVAVTDREENTTRFRYEEPSRPHFLTEIDDPLNRSISRSEYDDKGRLVQLFDSDDEVIEISYDPDISRQTVEDALGNPTIYEYDDRGNIVREIDALGGITSRTFDDENYPLTQTDPEGITVKQTYDGEGNIVTAEDDLNNVTRFTFNRFGEVTTKINPLGDTTTYVYDNRGNRLKLTNALGDTIEYEFDTTGQVIAITDALGHSTQFDYDPNGQVTLVTDARNHKTSYTYDDDGNQLSETTTATTDEGLQTYTSNWTYDRNSDMLTWTDPADQVITHEYDSQRNLVAVIDRLDRRSEYDFDAQGREIAVRHPDGTSETTIYDANGQEIATTDEAGRTTHSVYDALGRLEEVILPDETPEDLDDNPRIKTEFDKAGRVEARIDERGNRTEFDYDDANRLILSRDPLGYETYFRHDAEGKVIQEIDPLGRVTETIFDVVGRPVITLYPDSTRTEDQFDPAGRRVASIDQAGRITEYIYDELDRVIEILLPDQTRVKRTYDELSRLRTEEDPKGKVSQFEYDPANRMIKTQDGSVSRVTTYTYDAASNQTSMTDPLNHTTEFRYDARDRRIEMIYPDKTREKTTYTPTGEVETLTDAADQVTRFEYDARDRLTTVIDALNQRTEYRYDAVGNLTGIQDANTHLTRHEYSERNRRKATILPLNQRMTMTYDEVGNLKTSTDFNGDTISYEYDPLNRLAMKQLTETEAESYTYTPTGQMATATDSRGTTIYTYDERDRLLSRQEPDGRMIRYDYDEVGQRTQVQTPTRTIDYDYDLFRRLGRVTDPDMGVTQLTYDDADRLIGVKAPNGTQESRDYDTLDRLTQIRQENATKILASYDYTLDLVGNRTRVEEANGRVVNYDYDDLYRLTQEAITDPALGNRTIGYDYDPVGNRLLKQDSQDGDTTYTYDANDRLQTETRGEVTSYGYDANGNTLSRQEGTDPGDTFTWDRQNRLTSAQVQGTMAQYQYDVNGIRVRSVVDEQETRYLLDESQPYVQVAEESDPVGTVNRAYVNGHGLISQKQGSVRSYFHSDGLGSQRLLTDGSGEVSDAYTYDAYGQLLGSIGETPNVYRYVGEQLDPVLNQYYLRARYYDPRLGRFTARDLIDQILGDTLSLNRYNYVDGNPVNGVDPSGELIKGLTSLQSSLLIVSALTSTLASVGFALYRGISGTLEDTGEFPSKVIEKIPGLANIVRTPLNLGDRLEWQLAAREARICKDKGCSLSGFPVIFWGNEDELKNTTKHIYDAIVGSGGYTQNPVSNIPLSQKTLFRVFLLRRSKGHSRTWLTRTPQCRIRSAKFPDAPGMVGDRLVCDEYPFASVWIAGKPGYDLGIVSLRLVPEEEQSFQYPGSQANKLKDFYRRAAIKPDNPIDGWFGSFAQFSQKSFWIDRARRIQYFN